MNSKADVGFFSFASVFVSLVSLRISVAAVMLVVSAWAYLRQHSRCTVETIVAMNIKIIPAVSVSIQQTSGLGLKVTMGTERDGDACPCPCRCMRDSRSAKMKDEFSCVYSASMKGVDCGVE